MKKERKLRLLGFNDTPYLLIGIPLLSVLIPFVFFNADPDSGWRVLTFKFVVSGIYTTLYWLSCRSIMMYYRAKFPRYQQTRIRLVRSAVAILSVYVLINITMESLENMGALRHQETASELTYTVVPLLIIILVSSFYEGFFFYTRWYETVTETERLRRETVQSQLAGLRSQVNPHFLFNSLNTLTYIIPEDPDRAVTFVQKLSKVYRYVLEVRNESLIPLSSELEYLESYLFLLRERFGDNIQVELDVNEDLTDRKIIPLSLQILFENAIKHNIISTHRPLCIRLFHPNPDRLEVRNNLQRKKQVMASTRVGLENIKSRYAYFTQDKVEVTETAEHFSVRLPLIPAYHTAPAWHTI